MAKSRRFHFFAVISKRIELQRRAWPHLLAFFQTHILKKKINDLIKIKQVLTDSRCPHTSFQDGSKRGRSPKGANDLEFKHEDGIEASRLRFLSLEAEI